jgi:2-polyprenyl-6-methoxyphenol hydroxylase-like FAD-dependent oxidoreductase
MTPSRHHEVLVVGGGIGGLAAALALARAGRTVRLVEQAREFSEIGAGLQLGPNAMRAFDRLGVYDDIASAAVFPRRAVVLDALDGSELTVLDFGARFVNRYGYPYVVAHRSDVLTALLSACERQPGVVLETDRTVVEVAEDGERAEIRFADGESYTTDLLVGADGIRSKVRSLIDDSPPSFSGHVAYRGAIATANVPGDVAADDVLLWIGPGMHLMQYPVRRGELYNQVAVYERPAGHRDPIGSAAELESAFGRACDAVRGSVALIEKGRCWPVFDRDPVSVWSTDHCVLIGDAAHAMLQYLGQGACQALDDALALAAADEQHRADRHRAFKAYEEARVGTASRCQRTARPWGQLWHTGDPLTVAVRNRLFRMRRPDDYSELDWLYADPAPAGVQPA